MRDVIATPAPSAVRAMVATIGDGCPGIITGDDYAAVYDVHPLPAYADGLELAYVMVATVAPVVTVITDGDGTPALYCPRCAHDGLRGWDAAIVRSAAAGDFEPTMATCHDCGRTMANACTRWHLGALPTGADRFR